jgi:hypothetical protein
MFQANSDHRRFRPHLELFFELPHRRCILLHSTMIVHKLVRFVRIRSRYPRSDHVCHAAMSHASLASLHCT